MAARLSADRPSLKAATRSGRAAGLVAVLVAVLVTGLAAVLAAGLRRVGLAGGGMIGLFAEFKRALVKLAPRQAGHVGDFADGVFERHPRHRRAQQCVG